MNMNENQNVEIQPFDCFKQMTIIGKGACGKTSILNRYLKNEFLQANDATPIDCQDYDFSSYDKKMRLKIWDTSGQDELSRLRLFTVPISDYIMICYSVNDYESYKEVEDTLMPMLKSKAKEDVKIFLVATKLDTRTEDHGLTTEEGISLSQRINSIGFYECSSLTNEGIDELFKGIKSDMIGPIPSRMSRFLSKIFFCCA